MRNSLTSSPELFLGATTPEPNTGCWLWTRCLNADGYGRVKLRGKMVNAQRASWELHVGDLPAGLVVCHRCDNPACVNPAHLFLGTQTENVADMARKGRGREARGERNSFARLTDEAVREIRRLAEAGMPRPELMARFGVKRGAIDNVVAGRSWTHVEAQP